MSEWRVYTADIPRCTSCGMWMPFARYRRGQGTDAREITDYCPHCGKKMTAMPMCSGCSYGKGAWKEEFFKIFCEHFNSFLGLRRFYMNFEVFLIIITFIICLAMIDDMDNGLR